MWVPMSGFCRFAVMSGMAPQVVESPWLEILLREFGSGRHQVLELVHRGSTKSSILICLGSYVLCEGEKLPWFGARGRICYAAEKEGKGQEAVSSVRQALVANEWIVGEYGSQKPTRKVIHEWRQVMIDRGLDPEALDLPEWTNKAIRTVRCLRAEMETGDRNKEPSMRALGYNQGGTGDHYELLFNDDPSTARNSTSPTMKDNQKRIYIDLQSQLLPTGYEFTKGTRHAEDDLHGLILDEYSANYHVEVHPCWEPELQREDFVCGPDGQYRLKEKKLADVEVFWNGYEGLREDIQRERDGLPRLGEEERKLRALHNLAVQLHKRPASDFAKQFLNKVVASSDMVFWDDLFVCYEPSQVAGRLNHYVLTDSATGRDFRSSYRVVAVVSLDPADNAYVRDLSFGRWQPEEYMTKVLEAWQRWAARKVLFEKVSWQETFKSLLTALCRARGLAVPPVADVTGRSAMTKLSRIERLQPRLLAARNHTGNRGLWFDPSLKDKIQDGICAWKEILAEFRRVNDLQHLGADASRVILDIPDALSDMDALDREGQRLCRPPREREPKTPGPSYPQRVQSRPMAPEQEPYRKRVLEQVSGDVPTPPSWIRTRRAPLLLQEED